MILNSIFQLTLVAALPLSSLITEALPDADHKPEKPCEPSLPEEDEIDYDDDWDGDFWPSQNSVFTDKESV